MPGGGIAALPAPRALLTLGNFPMPNYLAFLRAVNVAGHGAIPMATLRAWAEKLGLQNPRTLLQSGNLAFESPERDGEKLEARLQSEAKKALGLETDFFVRTAAEWADILAANPFPQEARKDPAHLVVYVLKRAPGAGQVQALQASIQGRESVRAAGRQAYVVFPDGIGTSKLTLARIEKALGTRGTGRNWNTALKMAAVAERK